MRAVLVLLVWMSGCSRATGPAAAGASTPNATAERARTILSRHCGDCHLPNLATSNQHARAVFALERLDWFVSMSPQQLEKSVGMLQQRKSLTPEELAEMFRAGTRTPVVPTLDEERDYAAFVEQALHGAP